MIKKILAVDPLFTKAILQPLAERMEISSVEVAREEYPGWGGTNRWSPFC